MQTMDLRRGNFEANDLIVQCDAGSYVVACGAEGENEVVFVPRDDDAARREQARLAEIAGPGIPRCDTHPAPEPGRVIVRLVGLAGAVPLHVATPLTAAQLRAALTRLTSALSHAHSRGWFHGRIAAPLVLVDPRVECWLVGWADARPIRPGARNDAGLDEVSRDLRDVGMALLRHLLRAPPDAAGDLSDDEVEAAVIAIRADDPELARVLARLASADQRECYESATEVLTDLGERDESMPDVWAELPFVGRRSIVRLVMRRLELAGGPEGGLSSLELAGPAGSGRSRLLEECARAARERGIAVIVLDGRTGAQPWGPLGDLARQLLARTPADAPARQAPALTTLLAACVTESADVVARRPAAPLETADGVAAALADLAQAALGGQRAVLLLDDEDCLHPSARSAWRLLGRHVAETTDTHQALRALLVSATTAASPPRPAFPGTDTQARPERNTTVTDETGARHETIRIEDLTRPRIHRLLTSILAEPGMAAALVHDVHDLTGGRIAEIVEHLRLLAARGILRPVGRRWRLHDPGTPFRAITIPEATRRTLADAGPEATRIAELLAITPDMRLDRATLIELAEIPPHRFQHAVDAAERLGLILRSGAAWRLRTQTLRARIDAALPAERRRSLHREILFRLLDADPRDLPAIATHARGAGDPRAVEWTREAIAHLMSARRHPEVVAHYEESRDLIDPAGIDTSLKLDYCEALLEVGRIGPAADGAMEVLGLDHIDGILRGRATIIVALSARVAGDWRAVTRLSPSDDDLSPSRRAELRALRSIAFTVLSDTQVAARELRLAEAELSETQPSRAFVALKEYARALHFKKLLQGDHAVPIAARAAGIARREVAITTHVVLLDALAGILMNADRHRAATAVSMYGLRLERRRQPGSHAARARLHTTIGLIQAELCRSVRALRHLELAQALAERTGHATFALTARLRLILHRVASDAADPNDAVYIINLLSASTDESLRIAADHGALLAPSLLYFGKHRQIDRLLRHAIRLNARREAQAALGLAAMQLRMFLDLPLADVTAPIPGARLTTFARACRLPATPPMWHALIESGTSMREPAYSSGDLAYRIRSGTLDPQDASDAVPQLIDVDDCLARDTPFFGNMDLALTILIDVLPEQLERVDVSPELLRRSLARRAPLSLEWKRLLWLAVDARRRGDLANVPTLLDDALHQLATLRGAEIRTYSSTAYDRALQTFERVGFRRRRHTLCASELVSPTVAVEGRPRASPPSAWTELATRVLRGEVSSIYGTDVVELDAFVRLVCDMDGRWIVRHGADRFVHLDDSARRVDHCIDTWTEEALRCYIGTLRALRRPDHALATLTDAPAVLRSRSSLMRVILDCLGADATPLPLALTSTREREGVIRWFARGMEGPEPRLSDERIFTLNGHRTIRSLRDLQLAIRAEEPRLSAGATATVSATSQRHRGPEDRELIACILGIVASKGTAMLSDIQPEIAIPPRTLQRRLSETVAAGLLLRRGKGRGTVYEVARLP